MKRAGERGCPADQHRGQHARRRAQMEQRHRGPQHLARTELPGRRDRRGHREQVVPCGGHRLRRPGGARREEQAPHVLGRRGAVGHGSRTHQRVGERITLHHNVSHGLQLAGNLIDAGSSLGVGEDHLGPRQPQRVQQEVAFVCGVHRRAHRADACRAQPEVDPFRAGGAEQRHTVTAPNTQVGQDVRRRAGPLPHLFEGHLDTGDRHHHAVGMLLGPPIQHGGHGETVDTEIGGAEGSAPVSAHQASSHAPAAAGSGSPSAV